MDPTARDHLKRLQPEAYQAFAMVSWTLGLADRQTGWLSPVFHAEWQRVMIHTCVRFHLLAPAYSLMPDHAHLLWLGIHPDADQRSAVSFLRSSLRNQLLPARWQHQPYDHVLRRHERGTSAVASVAHYFFENPVRAGIAAVASDYPFSGACIPGMPDLDVHAPDYWCIFWDAYNSAVSH